MTTTNITTENTPDFAAIKQRQQATSASGDYAVVGTTLQTVGERLCETVDLRAGERVLDVAAGNWNATLAAARGFAEVTSTDYVGDLFDRGKARADAEGLSVKFRIADVEALPCDDAEYDCVLSTFGVMFAPNHAQAASEMSRVCRSGGSHRCCELDAGELHWPTVPDTRQARTTARRRSASSAVGHRGPPQ